MIKYRKQRNKLIVASATITVTLSAAIVLLKKYTDKKITELKGAVNKAEKNITKVRKENEALINKNRKLEDSKTGYVNAIKNLNDELEKAKTHNPVRKVQLTGKQLKRAGEYRSNQIKDTTNNAKAVASANVEIVSNQAKDIIGAVKEIATTVLDPSKSGLTKVIDTVGAVNNVKDQIGDVANGTNKEKNKEKMIDNINNKLKSLRKQYSAAVKDYNASSVNERKGKYAHVNGLKEKIHELEAKREKIINM